MRDTGAFNGTHLSQSNGRSLEECIGLNATVDLTNRIRDRRDVSRRNRQNSCFGMLVSGGKSVVGDEDVGAINNHR